MKISSFVIFGAIMLASCASSKLGSDSAEKSSSSRIISSRPSDEAAMIIHGRVERLWESDYFVTGKIELYPRNPVCVREINRRYANGKIGQKMGVGPGRNQEFISIPSNCGLHRIEMDLEGSALCGNGGAYYPPTVTRVTCLDE
jgi:hypothetical protein